MICFSGWIRTVSLFFTACLTFAILIMLFVPGCTKNKEPIRIGAIISMTGAASHLADLKGAIGLAADEVNSAGGINGRPIEVIFADSQTDPEIAKKCFQDLIRQNPLFIISTLSSVCEALSPLAEEEQIPLIGLVTSAPELTRGKNWIFRFYPTAEFEVPPIMTLLRKTGTKKLGIIYQNEPYGISVYQLLREKFEQDGGIVESMIFSNINEGHVQKQDRFLHSDSIYIVGYPKNIAQMIRILRSSGYSRPLFASSSATDDHVVFLPEANGTYMAAPIIYNHNFIYAKELAEKYEAMLNKKLTHYTAAGYDIVKLISSLLEGREISRNSVKKVIEEGFHFPSSLGDIMVEAGTMHEINFPLYPARIIDQQIVFLGD